MITANFLDIALIAETLTFLNEKLKNKASPTDFKDQKNLENTQPKKSSKNS